MCVLGIFYHLYHCSQGSGDATMPSYLQPGGAEVTQGEDTQKKGKDVNMDIGVVTIAPIEIFSTTSIVSPRFKPRASCCKFMARPPHSPTPAGAGLRFGI